MDEKTKNLIAKRMAELPENIRESLKKINWAEEISAIGKSRGLHVDQMEGLYIETVLVLVGLAHPNEYADNLKKAMSLSDVQISPIVNEVNEKIFKTVRQSLIDFIDKENRAEAELDTEEDSGANAMQSAGIEIEPDHLPMVASSPINASVEKTILQKTGMSVEDIPAPPETVIREKRIEMLDDLTNPPKTPYTGFSKLVDLNRTGSAKIPVEKTIYVDKAPNATSVTKTTSDPYREQPL